MKKINRYVDIVSGIFWIAVAAAAYILSLQIVQRASTQGTVGPAFMPRLVSVLIIVCGALVIANGVSSLKKGINEIGCFPEEKKDIATVLITILITIIYVSVLEMLGFVLSTAAFLIIQLSFFDVNWKSHIIRNIIIAVIVAVVTYALFRYVFSLSLPVGRIF